MYVVLRIDRFTKVTLYSVEVNKIWMLRNRWLSNSLAVYLICVSSDQAYKIHGTVGPPVSEINWSPQKIFKTEKKKRKNISEKKMKMLT